MLINVLFLHIKHTHHVSMEWFEVKLKVHKKKIVSFHLLSFQRF